jgi:hypothetical protein
MKTIILNETKESKYIFADDVTLTFTDDTIIAPSFIISDMNAGNATLIEGVTPPDDWYGNKYLFDNGEWTISPDWVETQQIRSVQAE